ncbi:MAG: hypothetical protein WAR24_03900 [Candidatus Acidiferrales bacterium]
MKKERERSKNTIAWAIFAVVFTVGGSALFLYLSAGTPYSPRTPDRDYVVSQDTFGSKSATDFFHAYQAAKAGEQEAFLQMMEDGLVYRVARGTRVGWDGNSSQGIAVCEIKSGPLVSKVLLLRADMLTVSP